MKVPPDGGDREEQNLTPPCEKNATINQRLSFHLFTFKRARATRLRPHSLDYCLELTSPWRVLTSLEGMDAKALLT
jgi:hypothetical protein